MKKSYFNLKGICYLWSTSTRGFFQYCQHGGGGIAGRCFWLGTCFRSCPSLPYSPSCWLFSMLNTQQQSLLRLGLLFCSVQKRNPHSVSFLPIFLSLDSEVNQMPSGISMPLPTLLSKNSIKYQIERPKDPLLTKSKTVKTNTQYYTIRWRKKFSKYINFWQTFIH